MRDMLLRLKKLEHSRLKKKDNARSNPVLSELCYNVSNLAMKIIEQEINRVPKIIEDLNNLCIH